MSALELWREKLAFLTAQEAIVSDPAQRFTLAKQIEEARAKIAALAGEAGPAAKPASRFEPIDAFLENDELEQAGAGLLDMIRGLVPDKAADDVRLWKARMVRANREQARGTLTREEYRVERTQLAHALTAMMRDLDATVERTRRMPPAAPVRLAGTPEKVLGAVSHLRSTGWMRRGLTMADAVCVVRGVYVGTGFVLPGGVVVTNHHILSHQDNADDAELEFGFEEGATKVSVRPAPGSWRGDPDLDCAMVRLPADFDATRWGHLTVAKAPILVDRHVNIIQHPGGAMKQIAVTANQVVSREAHRLFYTTDTLPGSSGSPVLNDNWEVVAIHAHGGNAVKDRSGAVVFANEGVAIAEALAALGLT